jgi:D-glycero-D-manno-heptose 1,7-bisphosphate phosphatase
VAEAVRRAAFLDRDGVVNVDRGYVHRWEDFSFAPGAVDAMRRLREAGYLLVIVTNQSGIARGMYSEADYQALTTRMRAALKEAGAEVAAVFHCPHHPDGTVPALRRACDCRKPQPGMLLEAARTLGLSMPDSVLVGDKPSDIEAAQAAGVGRAWLVRTADGQVASKRTRPGEPAPFADLAACVDDLLRTVAR